MIKAFIEKNCTHILTGLGCVGIVATAVLAGKAAIKANDILRNKSSENRAGIYVELPLKDKIKLTWKCFIPPVAVGIATGACFILGHKIDSKRLADMTTAYILSKEALSNYEDLMSKYEDEVKNECGEEAREKVTNAVENEFKPHDVNVDKVVTFYEPFTQKFFKAKYKDVIFAEAMLNKMFQEKYYCTFDEFLRYLPLKPTRFTKDIGWFLDDTFSYNSSYFGNWINIAFYHCKDEEHGDYISLSYNHGPCEPDEPEEWFGHR